MGVFNISKLMKKKELERRLNSLDTIESTVIKIYDFYNISKDATIKLIDLKRDFYIKKYLIENI